MDVDRVSNLLGAFYLTCPVELQVRVTDFVEDFVMRPFTYCLPVAVAVALFPDLLPEILETLQVVALAAADGVTFVHLAVPFP